MGTALNENLMISGKFRHENYLSINTMLVSLR